MKMVVGFPKSDGQVLYGDEVSILYNVRGGLIDQAVKDMTIANADYIYLKRDTFPDADGCLNTICTADTTSRFNTSFYTNCLDYGNVAGVCQLTCSIVNTAGTPAGTNATVCSTFIRAFYCSGVPGSCGYTCVVACYPGANAYDITSYDCFCLVMCATGTSVTSADLEGTGQYSACLHVNGVALYNVSQSPTSSNFSCVQCVAIQKVSGTTYDVYLNGSCVCQVSNPTVCWCDQACSYGETDVSVRGFNTFVYTTVCRFKVCESCVRSAAIANSFCPRSIYLGGLKTGSGTVVYSVIDAANSCVLVSDAPFNSGACLAGSACACCLIVNVKQCSDAESCISNWGYYIDR